MSTPAGQDGYTLAEAEAIIRRRDAEMACALDGHRPRVFVSPLLGFCECGTYQWTCTAQGQNGSGGA